MLRNLRELSYQHIIAERDVKPFLIFASFLLTFFISRAVVYLFPTLNLIIFKYHIHHFYYGIILLAVSNYMTLVGHSEGLRRLCAILMGIGLGLIADEMGILLMCGTKGHFCDPSAIYWSRLQFDIVIYATLLFFVVLFVPPVWKRIKTWRQ